MGLPDTSIRVEYLLILLWTAWGGGAGGADPHLFQS